MSRKLVLQIEPSKNGMSVRLQKADDITAISSESFQFANSPQWGQPNAVLVYGQSLYNSIVAHLGIANELKTKLKPNDAARQPIYLHIRVASAEGLYWETLCDPQAQFLALDARWQIVRISEPIDSTEVETQVFRPPLKIMAFLGARQYKADDEWAKLYASIQKFASADFPISVQVYIGEPDLLLTIAEEDSPALKIQTFPVPNNDIEVLDAIDDFEPHLLHFFCHGAADSGKPRIYLANAKDFLGNPNGLIELTRSALMSRPVIRTVWLVTLNCCEGSTADKNVSSLTYSLVAGGVPAALGMMEPFDKAAAHEFCEFFYPAVLDLIKQLLAEAVPGKEMEVDWADALFPPRRAISARYGNNYNSDRRWALPVLYVRPEIFKIRLPDETKPDTMQGETITRLIEILKNIPNSEQLTKFL